MNSTEKTTIPVLYYIEKVTNLKTSEQTDGLTVGIEGILTFSELRAIIKITNP